VRTPEESVQKEVAGKSYHHVKRWAVYNSGILATEILTAGVFYSKRNMGGERGKKRRPKWSLRLVPFHGRFKLGRRDVQEGRKPGPEERGSGRSLIETSFLHRRDRPTLFPNPGGEKGRRKGSNRKEARVGLKNRRSSNRGGSKENGLKKDIRGVVFRGKELQYQLGSMNCTGGLRGNMPRVWEKALSNTVMGGTRCALATSLSR